MDNIAAILTFLVFLQQTNFILGSYIIPNEVFKSIELIAGSKNQYISLQDQKRNTVKDVIQHYFIELNTLKIRKTGLLGNDTIGNSAVFIEDVRQIKKFEQFQVPNRILITELKSEDEEM